MRLWLCHGLGSRLLFLDLGRRLRCLRLGRRLLRLGLGLVCGWLGLLLRLNIGRRSTIGSFGLLLFAGAVILFVFG